MPKPRRSINTVTKMISKGLRDIEALYRIGIVVRAVLSRHVLKKEWSYGLIHLDDR